MLFNSISFAIFFPVVLTLYWSLQKTKLKWQNILLLLASYFFYSCWDWRFLFLLFFSTLLDFFTGLQIARSTSGRKKNWFWLSIIINLGFLAVFKYYNFFISSFVDFLKVFNVSISYSTLNIILPVGISFYTFHGLSYIIDISKGRIQPEKNFIDYAVFVSFFPLLVAGPIERATHLLPQIKKERVFEYSRFVDGLRQILWGFFMKVVVADNCAVVVNEVYAHSDSYSGYSLLAASVLFAFQIYGDFAGYSNIALGTARLMGIELLQNFNSPFISKSITEFWRRWHISLSTWFNDYLYMPLATHFRDWNRWGIVFSIVLVFFLSGLWHGAGWNFIVYGLIHGFAIAIEFLLKNQRKKLQKKMNENIHTFLSVFCMFSIVSFSWIFFRSPDLHSAWRFIGSIFNGLTEFSNLYEAVQLLKNKIGLRFSAVLILFAFMEWQGRENKYAIEFFAAKWPTFLRWVAYYLFIIIIFYFSGKEQQFIYFQF